MNVTADAAAGAILATVEIEAPPERVFRALTSDEITRWWVRPGVFDTRQWTGDVRVGGQWQATGMARGKPYRLSGEFLEVDPPRRLAHTWCLEGGPATPTTVIFELEALPGGTRLTLRHEGFAEPDFCTANRVGWETSFAKLKEIL
jgi:uncharacterized protein YndB with AHSA1/START domain